MPDSNTRNCYKRKYTFTAEDRRRGGQARAQQPSFYEASLKGWEAACDRHGKKVMLALIRPKEEKAGRKCGRK